MLWYHFANGLRDGGEDFKRRNRYRVTRHSEEKGLDGPQRVRRVSEGVMTASEGVVTISELIVRTSGLVRD